MLEVDEVRKFVTNNVVKGVWCRCEIEAYWAKHGALVMTFRAYRLLSRGMSASEPIGEQFFIVGDKTAQSGLQCFFRDVFDGRVSDPRPSTWEG